MKYVFDASVAVKCVLPEKDSPKAVRLLNDYRKAIHELIAPDIFPIEIAPLRERREDIPLLVNFFVSKFSARMRKQITSIPRHAMEILTNCPWNGNVRELANFIERAVIVTQGEELEVPIAALHASSDAVFAVRSPYSFRQAECSVIMEALRAASGRIAGKGGAAERLGLKRTTLQNKIRRLGIAREQYRHY